MKSLSISEIQLISIGIITSLIALIRLNTTEKMIVRGKKITIKICINILYAIWIIFHIPHVAPNPIMNKVTTTQNNKMNISFKLKLITRYIGNSTNIFINKAQNLPKFVFVSILYKHVNGLYISILSN